MHEENTSRVGKNPGSGGPSFNPGITSMLPEKKSTDSEVGDFLADIGSNVSPGLSEDREAEPELGRRKY